MKNYELLSVLPGTLTEEEAQTIAAQIKETIEKNGGKEVTLEYSGKSRLAYPMKHIRYGYFFISTFVAEESDTRIIQDKIRFINNILRFICKIYNPSQKVGLVFGENTVSSSEEPAMMTPVAEATTEVYTAPVVEAAPLKETVQEEAPVVVEDAKKAEPSKDEISMEEIDQKLDELLEKDI